MHKRTLLVSLAVLLLLSAVFLYYANRHTVSTDNAYVKTDIIPVSSRLSGHVSDYQVEDYQTVKTGQSLLKLDTTSLQLRKLQQQAQIRNLEAQLATATARKSIQQINIELQLVALTQSDIELKRINKQLKRSEALIASGDMPGEQHDNTKASAELALAHQQESQLALKHAQMQLDILDTEIARIQALYDQAQAMLAQIDQDLEDSVIRAPRNGMIGKRLIQNGQYVTQGSPVLYLLPEHAVWIIANIKETHINAITPGQPVDITIDAFPGTDWAGEVVDTSPATGSEFSPIPPSNATGHFTRVTQTVPVKIRLLPNPHSDRLKPGMSARILVHTEARPGPHTQ
ncbi:HlyD family secretion protein [Kistimonas asteriae]|uniref:HlyD family secretion protein n=1 Tax=Kistimonas asteriae TaxID=517724 RepID=UPI001BAB2CBC|nr:HlyD family secretion protein [Kistimonas asteriae]